MTDWSDLTKGKARELARAYVVAIAKADCPEELPSDAWLNVRLRELGCPEDQLGISRERIKTMPLTELTDGAA